ncbi:DUF3301 domain-containing protein [Alteromonas sp. ASW11-130]|uniref:DUF3301 domain-containing protein n=1 Tax=Alteromonas sp. ASW11-130 TaxID=3015775 RepID=UPI00224240C1|nr:DUF3301 domain-containing protein [Alteromonas sp. ASW11-130]MCW8091678.1 DUF3301 domain-containing protein [Alteromonas sp. ASW11-130]
MSIGELSFLLLLAFIGFQFWRIRSISESAHEHVLHYCQKNQLQLLSLSRKKTRISVRFGPLDWYSVFEFEFSSTGEDRYTGSFEMVGKRIVNIYTPAHRMN